MHAVRHSINDNVICECVRVEEVYRIRVVGIVLLNSKLFRRSEFRVNAEDRGGVQIIPR